MTATVTDLTNRREILRSNRDEMERRSAVAFRGGRLADSKFYADEAERLGRQLDDVNAELIGLGH